ncbi:conserved hypothetical protein [delta proteobacterium NaphS2]|nr:conserved hypothetical protein [delta proteobacterium NaphS2]
MTKLVHALDAKLAIQIVPKEENVKRWYKVIESGKEKRITPSKAWPLKPKVEKELTQNNELEAYRLG